MIHARVAAKRKKLLGVFCDALIADGHRFLGERQRGSAGEIDLVLLAGKCAIRDEVFRRPISAILHDLRGLRIVRPRERRRFLIARIVLEITRPAHHVKQRQLRRADRSQHRRQHLFAHAVSPRDFVAALPTAGVLLQRAAIPRVHQHNRDTVRLDVDLLGEPPAISLRGNLAGIIGVELAIKIGAQADGRVVHGGDFHWC